MSKLNYLAASVATSQVQLIGYSPSVAPDGRGTWTYEYSGTDAGIAAAASVLRGYGAQTHVNIGSGVATLSASFPFYPGEDPSAAAPSPGAEVPVDRYSVKFGAENVSLFALPTATIEADSLIDAAQYKKEITDNVSDGVALTLNPESYPFAVVIHRLLSHGIEFAQVLRPTIRRTRTYSYQYADRRIISFNQQVFSSFSLFSIFGFPSDIAAIIPFNPSAAETPIGSTWAWKITDQELDYNPTNRKWEESVTWEFGAADTGIYTVV